MSDTAWFGNIGGIELPYGATEDRIRMSFVETRLALEKIVREVGKLRAGGTGSTFSSITNKTINVSGSPILSLSYPMTVSVSDELFPNGITLPFADQGMTITGVEIQADPQIKANGDITFTLSTARGGTSLGTVTILSGTNVGRNLAINFPVPQGGGLFMRSPAAIGNIQNLYVIQLRAIPSATLKALF